MATAFWHYPSTSTRPAWPKDSKTVLGYGFGYVTDLVDTKNGKNRFLSLEDSNLNFGIWIFLSRAQFYVLYPSNRVSRSCAHKNMPNYWGGSEHFCVTSQFLLLWITRICFPECASRISRCVLVLHVYCVVALYKHTIVTGMTQGFQNCAWIRFWIRNRSCGYEKL